MDAAGLQRSECKPLTDQDREHAAARRLLQRPQAIGFATALADKDPLRGNTELPQRLSVDQPSRSRTAQPEHRSVILKTGPGRCFHTVAVDARPPSGKRGDEAEAGGVAFITEKLMDAGRTKPFIG